MSLKVTAGQQGGIFCRSEEGRLHYCPNCDNSLDLQRIAELETELQLLRLQLAERQILPLFAVLEDQKPRSKKRTYFLGRRQTDFNYPRYFLYKECSEDEAIASTQSMNRPRPARISQISTDQQIREAFHASGYTLAHADSWPHFYAFAEQVRRNAETGSLVWTDAYIAGTRVGYQFKIQKAPGEAPAF